MNRVFKAKAPAKINLYLDVLGLREDGYHEIKTIFQTIRLCDELYFNIQEKDIDIQCNNPNIPTNENNLVYKSAKEFFDFAKIKRGIKIFLKKKIPTQAGLGGGSSDAAVTLFALNKIFKTNFSLFQLVKIGEKIGSDVPFFLVGGTAIGTGRGEIIFPLKDISKFFIILGFPKIGVSTKEAYKRIDRVLTENSTRLKIEGIVRKILAGEFGKEDMFNRFEEAINEKGIIACKSKLVNAGAEKVLKFI
ncbi:MAG: 4-(cytidine 5'-diphospho)-2-C-methyl-D-erythritol kinase [Acidobacteria bacterium]|nr:4-(cytidine 5'-diphospho)-2-C-methyl-D-erythritol kinase [Acidobacteriota bacterium]